MTLPLTPDMVAAAYDFLRECPPYKRWRLPHSDEIAFKIARDHGIHGYCLAKKGEYTLAICDTGVGHTSTLIETLAHEMIHLRQAIAKTETPGAIHNAEFRRISAKVCAIHGWDFRAFV